MFARLANALIAVCFLSLAICFSTHDAQGSPALGNQNVTASFPILAPHQEILLCVKAGNRIEPAQLKGENFVTYRSSIRALARAAVNSPRLQARVFRLRQKRTAANRACLLGPSESLGVLAEDPLCATVDINADGVVNHADLSLIKKAIRRHQAGFDQSTLDLAIACWGKLNSSSSSSLASTPPSSVPIPSSARSSSSRPQSSAGASSLSSSASTQQTSSSAVSSSISSRPASSRSSRQSSVSSAVSSSKSSSRSSALSSSAVPNSSAQSSSRSSALSSSSVLSSSAQSSSALSSSAGSLDPLEPEVELTITQISQAVLYDNLINRLPQNRIAGSAGNLTARQLIASEFQAAGLQPGQGSSYYQPFSSGTRANVIGILPGQDPLLKNEAIVIGAHYDDTGYGADDNGSGTVALMEAARATARVKTLLKRTLIFIAFDAEEGGLLGSHYYVANPVHPLSQTIYMINLDMIGYLVKQGKLLAMGAQSQSPRAALLLKAICQKYPSAGIPDLSDGCGCSSDWASFRGLVPYVFLHTGNSGISPYHTPGDTPEKIDYAGLTVITKITFELAWRISEDPVRPVSSLQAIISTLEPLELREEC